MNKIQYIFSLLWMYEYKEKKYGTWDELLRDNPELNKDKKKKKSKLKGLENYESSNIKFKKEAEKV